MSGFIAIDMSALSESDAARKTSLMDLPPEMRLLILPRLNLNDLRSMRLVSRKIRSEIDHGVGLHVILRGPKPWKDWTFTDDLRWLRAFGNPEPKRVQHNINWISNTLVRSLDIGRFVGLSFDPLTLVPSPFTLQRLVIHLDEDPAPKSKVLETLAAYNQLRTLSITCSVLWPRLLWESQLDKYLLFCVGFCKDVLASLMSKQGLKEFRLISNIWCAWILETETFLGTPPEPDPGEALLQYPSTLTSIKIQLQIYRDLKDWVPWKVFLDRQTQLRDLCVDIGFPYWNYFTTVIRNNVNTLKNIDVVMSNWAIKRSQNLDEVPPEADQLNWTVFLTQSQNLNTLKVTMNACVPVFTTNPATTLNFAQLQLTELTTLELQGVLLEQAEFTKIFGDLPALRDLTLKYWSRAMIVIPEFMRQVWELLANALQQNHLERIQLTDWSVASCPTELQEMISSQQNYTTVWPARLSSMYTVFVALVLGKRLTMTIMRQVDHL